MLLALSFLVRLQLSTDTFLHEFDERYHALVAKHLIQHPLKPTLYENPALPYDYKDWINNHIWLSKPPLPLWLMALSLKIFGLNEWAVRFPFVILATLASWIVFLIAKRFLLERIAIVPAVLLAFHGLMTDLCTGRLSSDAVETTFLFFVFWGMYYVFRKPTHELKWRDYIMVGCLSGAALMSKWQPALIIPLVMLIAHWDKTSIRKHLVGMSLVGICILAVASPWLVYCWFAYPTETMWLFKSLFMPVYDTSVSPDGKWYSYLLDFGNFFGFSSFVLIVYSLISNHAIRAIFYNRSKRIAFYIWMLLPLVVFSFAEAKRGTYIFISAPAVFIFISIWLNHEIKSQRWVRWVAAVSVVSIMVYSMDKLVLISSKPHHQVWSDELKARKYPSDTVIFNEPHYIEAMFYHDITAYPPK